MVQQISALTNPALPEDEADHVDLRSSALSEVSDWSPHVSRRPSSFLPRQSFLTSLGIRQLYSSLRQDELAEWVECLLTNSRLLHSVTVCLQHRAPARKNASKGGRARRSSRSSRVSCRAQLSFRGPVHIPYRDASDFSQCDARTRHF